MPVRKKLKVTYSNGMERIFESGTDFCREYHYQPSYLSVVLIREKIPYRWNTENQIVKIERA